MKRQPLQRAPSPTRSILHAAALTFCVFTPAAFAGAADPGSPAWLRAIPSWVPPWLPPFAGRGHVVLVHFPIALLIVAAMCELWGAVRRRPDASHAALVCLVTGAIAAAASAATGWINADLEGSRTGMADTLWLHRWIGVAAAGVALFTALVVAPLLRPGGRGPVGLYRAGTLVAAVLAGFAGHFGGTLVHGENYFWSILFPQSADAATGDNGTRTVPAWPPGMATAPGSIDFQNTIRPIFETRCVECHGPYKKKGGLRLDLRDGAFNRQPKDWVIVPGKPDQSDLLRRVTLPPSDPDFMPDGDKPLNPDEIAALRAWISEGAHWPDDPARPDQKPAPATPTPPASLGKNLGAGHPPPADPFQDGASRPKIDARAMLAADAIRAKHGVVVDLGADDPRLSVDLSVIAPPIGDADLALLNDLRPTIAWLNLSRTAITDRGIASLKDLPELERLRLEWTAIGDSGLDFAATCAKLRSLNLVGTKVTDAGLAKLAACGSLRKVFVWNTGVTPEGIAAFRAARADVDVVEGVQE